ncbi:uncharacterized protein METZ01_LOCUS470091, partial [marine metagenome]
VVNDDYVTIVKWYVNNGQKVIIDDLLFEFETSKTIVEVRAEASGFVNITEKIGAEVKIGQEVGRLHEQAREVSGEKVSSKAGELSSVENIPE